MADRMASVQTIIAYVLLKKNKPKQVAEMMGVPENSIYQIKSRYSPENEDLDRDFDQLINWVKLLKE